MSQTRRQMHLAVFWLGTGNHTAGWRMEGASDSNCDWSAVEAGANIAERGKFDLFFISDSLAPDNADHPSFLTRYEPTTLVGALSKSTKLVGLGATVSTSFSEPYNVARIFATLQSLSEGRVGWNVVTSTSDIAAMNFSMKHHHDHDKRYEIANEFVDVVRGLWNTWDEGAVIKDRKTGAYVDFSKIHRLDHEGQYYSVRGPLNIERSPYGQPLIIQAGGSAPGQELSARTADVVFTVVGGDPEAAKNAYDGLKQRLPKYGRKSEDLALLPGVMPIIGSTEQEARENLNRLQSWLSREHIEGLVSNRIGHDLSSYPLDGPIPELPQTNKNQTFSKTMLDKARADNLTLRDLYNLTAAARGHWVVHGTPSRIADTLEEWFRAGRADGFMILPPYFPGAFDDFVDQVVPELQRRGLFRQDYEGATMRDHFKAR